MIEEMSTGLWRDEHEQSYYRDLYNSRPPREYRPNLNAPAIRSNEYVADTDWESHNIPHLDDPPLFRPFPDSDPVERPITYEQSKAMSEFFIKDMEEQYQPTQDTDEMSLMDKIQGLNTIPDLNDLTEALVQLREVFAEDDPDIVSLSTAIRGLRTIPESIGHATGMMLDEINQAIDRLTDGQAMQETEPDPFQMQYDPHTIAQEIYDHQMLYMANPLLMPELIKPVQDLAPGL
jgi:hypothetical protein